MCKIIVWKVLFPLLFLHNFLAHLHAQMAQQSIQYVDWYNIHSVLNSIGQWQLQVPEQFVRNKMMPFIQQFRRQLNPMTEIISMPAQQNGGISSAYQLNPNNPNQVARFSHVDLNPPEQRTYRNGPASTREDLAGMIVREMWRKAKTHCVQCSSTGSRGQCELVNPGCGYPYQLFDDQARQIHCTVILRKESGRTQLHAQMECNTLPATPSLMGSVLATNYQRNWRWMCVNCTPSVYPALNKGNNIPWKNRANNSNAYGRIDLNNNNGGGGEGAVANDAWADAYYTGVGQRNVLRVWTDRKYSRIYQISNAEGRDIARFINRVRAEIARGEAPNLPVAAAMNQIKWKPSLASEAQRQLYSRDNDAVNIIDLEFTLLIPNARRAGLVSGRGQNFVDLDAHSLLLWTVRNYLEMFTNQQGLQCTSNGTCKATCRKGSQRTRVIPWQRMAENPADFHCYPYELLYDRSHSIGCAVRFVTKQRTHLQAKMVCVIEHQQGRNGSVRRMMHRHNVYKVGTACSRCENSHYCDQRTKLCVARNALQRGYEPIERLKLSSDNFDNVTAFNGNDRRGVGYGGAGGGGGVAFNNNFNVNEDGGGAWPPYGPNNGNGERYGRNRGRFVGRNNNGNIYNNNNNNNNFDTNGLYGGVGDGGYGGSGMPGAFGMTGFRGGFDNGIGGNYMGGAGGGNGFPTAGGGFGGNGNFAGNNGYPPNYDGIDPVIRRR